MEFITRSRQVPDMVDAEQFRQRTIPLRVRKESIKEKPFVVAFENSDGYRAGQRITEDEFYDILDVYDAVMVHWAPNPVHDEKDHFLLYREAKQVDFQGEDVRNRRNRKRSEEVVGDFGWYHHGRHLAVDMSIGLHCLDDDLWAELP